MVWHGWFGPFEDFMELDIQELPKSKVELSFKLSPEELEVFWQKAVKKLGKDLEIQGFRKGKLPEDIAQKYLPQDEIYKAMLEEAVRNSYLKALREKKLEPLSLPEAEVLQEPVLKERAETKEKEKASFTSPLIFKIRVEVLPKFSLPDYKKIASQTERRKVEVEEKEVSDSLKWLQKSRAKTSQVLRPCQEGDFVEIEFSSPQATKGQTQKDSFILGQGRLLPGFEDNLRGMEAGQEKEFSLRFPQEHFQKELAGKEANFKVKLKGVYKIELPELNDEFAKSLGQFENLSALKESLRKGLLEEKEIAESQRLREEILEKIGEVTDIPLPESLVEREKERMLQELKESIERQFQFSFEKYLKQTGKTEKELKQSFEEGAKRRIRNFLLLDRIAEKEGIEVSSQEVEERTQEILKNYPSPEEAKNRGLDPERLKAYNREVIRNEKTLALLESFSQSQ